MFEIFVDSGSNLPAEIVRQYHIHVIPFHTTVDGKEVDSFNENLSLEEEREYGHAYYQAMREGAKVKTSLINQGEFMEAFEPVLKDGKDVLYISISKNISGTYNAAKLAGEDLADEYTENKVYLVDSLNGSLAAGILAIYAYEMNEEGKTIVEIQETLTGYVQQMNGLFTVGDLKYLAATGRVSNLKSFIGNALHVKPILKGNQEGFIVQFKNVRGRKKALKQVIDLVCNNIVEPTKQIIGIAHADAYEESLYVMEEIQKRVNVRQFINTTYDFCTGSHVGPDTIALFFMGKDRSLDL